MKSYLDTIRKPVSLPLLPGEEVIKYYTASYDTGSSLASSWRLGNLYLTNKRLLFVQGRKILFKVLLSQIKTINIVKRGWILGKKVKQLNIVSEGRKVPYIAIKDPENWKKAIDERTPDSQSIPSDPQSTTPNSSQPDEVILKEKGSYLTPGQLRWWLGTLLLTPKKLTFFTYKSGFVWETPLSSIKDLRIEKRVYGVSKSDTICVVYESFGELSKAWIIALNLETWRKELYKRVLLKVDRETLNKIVTELDADSKEILMFLYENRHARIDTLAKLIEAPTHMDILLKIREIINPTAEKIIGYPILSFESSKVDRETGEKVLFSWWLAGQPHKERKEPLLDIFDEDADLIVYLELLAIKEDKLRLSVANNKLIIDADKDYHKEISLPVVVKAKSFIKRYKNNILEVRLKKADYKSV
ncbi:MAG: Hsp20/alpha crystallin family protein [Atribacteria sp.]|nr:Hsp20/alpha crystallin family protein [Candidatus Atribacteria bacterium]